MTSEDYKKAMECLEPDPFFRARAAAAVEAGGRPRRRLLRMVVIAAAACLALVGTAFAVTELSNLNIRVWKETGISTNGHTVEFAVDFYPLDTFSQELRDLAAIHPGHIRHIGEESAHQYFKTWGEAHEFIGLTLFRNPVLDSAEPGPTGTNPWEYHRGSSDPDKTHLMLLASVTDDGELDVIQTDGSCVVDGVWVRVFEGIYTERAEGTLYFDSKGYPTTPEGQPINGHCENPLGDGRHARLDMILGDGYEVTQENYTTPNGLEVLIIQSIRPDPKKSTVCCAYFLVDGAMFQVIAGSDGPNCELTQPEPEQAMEVLKKVLDGFILE